MSKVICNAIFHHKCKTDCDHGKPHREMETRWSRKAKDCASRVSFCEDAEKQCKCLPTDDSPLSDAT